MSQVTNLAFFRARRGRSEALGAALAALVKPTRREAGCLNYDLHRFVDNANVWFVYLNWRSPDSLDSHMLSEHLQAFLKATPDLVAGQRLISLGANVLAVAGHQSEISRLAALLGPGTLKTSVADVSDAEQVLAYATRAFALWSQIDGFANHAGIQAPMRPTVEFSEEDFDRVIAVNIRGVFLGMKHVLPRLREDGSIVNMSSALGVAGGAGICAYVASKHAIIGLTKTAALEQGPRGVRVNACCPGPIAGRMTFTLAEELFAVSKNRLRRWSRSVGTAPLKMLWALCPICCPMIPAVRQAPHTLSTAVSRQPDYGFSRNSSVTETSARNGAWR